MMDFSRDLELKRNFTFTPFFLSKEFYSPLLPLKKINRSSESLPSLQEIGIRQLMVYEGSLPKKRVENNTKATSNSTNLRYDLVVGNMCVHSEKKHVLTQVFRQTFFPSTEVRAKLAKQLNMTPRSVQIWFQNKRQSWRSRKHIPSAKPKRRA